MNNEGSHSDRHQQSRWTACLSSRYGPSLKATPATPSEALPASLASGGCLLVLSMKDGTELNTALGDSRRAFLESRAKLYVMVADFYTSYF